jgi:site-specific DNA-cytosine methylase
MRAIGLLAGVGSLLREARDAGFTIDANVETRRVYTIPWAKALSWDLNFPKVPLISDPRLIIPNARPDLIIGHPPCGAHSQLGNSGQPAHLTTEVRRAMQKVRHQRVGLLPFYVEQVSVMKPRMFVLDNLPKILGTVAPEEWWRTVLPDYRLTFIIMLNWDYGTPQLRKRLWVVGARKPMKPFVLVPPNKRLTGPATALEAFEGLPWEPWLDLPELGHVHIAPDDRLTGDYRTTTKDLNVTRASELALGFLSIPPNTAWPYLTRFKRLAVKIGRQRIPHDGRSRTITGLPSVHHPLTGWPLTPRERARLMDWPDNFKLGTADLDGYSRRELMRLTLLTGKAVPSGFPRYLLPQILNHLEKNK